MNFKNKKPIINSSDTYSAISHYKGDVAKLYNKNRHSSLKWKREQILIEKIINGLPENSIILDLPIGTGRLLPFYKNRNHRVYGIDISCDMLDETKNSNIGESSIIELKQGNAEKIPLTDKSVDYVICLRLLNLVPLSVLENIIKEFTRVSRKGIIFQVRAIEKAGTFKLLTKMLIDYRTHLNRFIHFFYSLIIKSLKFLNIKPNNQDKKSTNKKYFLHKIEDINIILKKQDLSINKIIEVDKGMNFLKGQYKPFLIIDCLKRSK